MERFDESLQVLSIFEIHPEAPYPFPQRADLLAAQVLWLKTSRRRVVKLNVPRDKQLRNSGEWDVTRFEAMLRGARKDMRRPAVKDEAIELLASLEKKYGGYWKARGEQVLARFGDPDVIGDDPRLLDWSRRFAVIGRNSILRSRCSIGPRNWNRPTARGFGRENAIFGGVNHSGKGDADAAAQRFLKIADQLGTSPLAADALLGAARALSFLSGWRR